MVLVRDVLQVKFGQMDKILEGVKAMVASGQTSMTSRVLTDISGKHFTLVIEAKVESVDAYWAAMQATFAEQEQSDQADAFNQLIESGHREFYTIEWEAE